MEKQNNEKESGKKPSGKKISLADDFKIEERNEEDTIGVGTFTPSAGWIPTRLDVGLLHEAIEKVMRLKDRGDYDDVEVIIWSNPRAKTGVYPLVLTKGQMVARHTKSIKGVVVCPLTGD